MPTLAPPPLPRGATTPTVVCVLGMHRSGTSVAARMLNVLGVSLGPAEQLVRAAADNPKGFWEHQPIVELNDAILARLGGNCVRLPDFPDGWETSPEMEDLRARARDILREGFGDTALWAWKDPRTCLTLPFWQALLPPLRYVICLRNPADVARSLERRSGMPRERGVYLWLEYLRRALARTAGRPRCVVYYDRFVDDAAGELRRLAAFLGVPERAERAEVREAAAGFVEAGLRHHRAARCDDASSAALVLAGRAYAAIERADAFDEREIQQSLASALSAIDRGAVPWLRRWAGQAGPR